MAVELLIRQLVRLPLFKGLTQRQLAEIVRRAERVLYHPGGMIIEENAEGDAAILIVSGEAVRVSGPELKARLEPVPQGALLGEAAMLVETTYGSTVVARGHVRALHIRREELHALMMSDPSIADRLVQNIARRLLRLAEELRRLDSILAGKGGGAHGPRRAAAGTPLPAPVH
jgi:CRP-like cAMP-binding protein